MKNKLYGNVCIVDMENAKEHNGHPLIGEQFRIVAYFESEEEAVNWLDSYEDKAKVARGGFTIDVYDLED